MPTYPIIHKETGEQKEVSMSIAEWEEFKEDNPLWIRDWSDPSTAPNSAEIGEWKDRLQKSHPSWKHILQKAKKSGGMRASGMETL
jgi:hypothetical protein